MLSSLRKNKRPRDLLLVFQLLCIVLLFFFFRAEEGMDASIAYRALGLILIIYVSNYILGKISNGDNYIFLIVSMLLTLGIVTAFRIDPSYGVLQMVWSIAGILLFYGVYFLIKYFPRLEKLGSLYILLAVGLTLSTLIFGSTLGGARNWIQIGNRVYVQPSEVTKIMIMFILASFYSNYDKYRDMKYASYIIMGILYFFVFCLFIQRDLGTAVIFLGMFLAIQFVYEKNRKMILLNLALMFFGGIMGYLLFSHVQVRMRIWLDPWSDAYGKGRQIVQSLFAIAEGGFFGSGIGMGYPKLIPVSYSDFIFPLICEEMGISMGIAIIMLYMILVYRGIKIALHQEYIFYRILALSVSVLFSIQAFLNIGGVIKLIPMTGLTLPFVSYGGSSMLSSFMCLGILQVTSEDLSFKFERSDGREA